MRITKMMLPTSTSRTFHVNKIIGFALAYLSAAFISIAYGQEATLELTELDGNNGFVIERAGGGTIAGLGDVNQDGLDDVFVTDAGGLQGYVVYGSVQAFDATFDLSKIDGSNGFKLTGGIPISSAISEDVNGDGDLDLIFGSSLASPNGSRSGAVHIVFGPTTAFGPAFDLTRLYGINGFTVRGEGPGDQVGYSVASAGDFNNDGLNDILIGSLFDFFKSGRAYVVFGSAAPRSPIFELLDLDGTNGFALVSNEPGINFGRSVTTADINNDGRNDLVVGANDGDVGRAYVVYGSSEPFPTRVSIANLSSDKGFVISGERESTEGRGSDYLGYSVANAGDVNGDGRGDVVIGAPLANSGAGVSYVLFDIDPDSSSDIDITTVNGRNGFVVNGVAPRRDFFGGSVAAADIDGDGFSDIIVGAKLADPNQNQSGAAYVVYGSDQEFNAELDASALNGSNGFSINGSGVNANAGTAVANAGDINGDGFEDILLSENGRSRSIVVFGKARSGSVRPISCGEPDFDPTSEAGIFVWQECVSGQPTGRWHIRVAVGPNATGQTIIDGVLQADSNLTARAVYQEPSDVMKSAAQSLRFRLRMAAGYIDGIDLQTTPSASLCLDLSRNDRQIPVRAGSARQTISGFGRLVNLATGENCTILPPLDTCGRRDLGNDGVYAYRDCISDRWRFELVSPNNNNPTSELKVFSGRITSNTRFSELKSSSFERGDLVELTTPNTLIHTLRTRSGVVIGQDAFEVTARNAASLCYQPDPRYAMAETTIFVGQHQIPRRVSGDGQSVDLLTGQKNCGAAP